MNDQIHFGPLEEAAPAGALRPDENHHFAVVTYGAPREGELPIYVDLDALAEIETHARSDMSVELGGVLLGGAYIDGGGQPFVVISDMLPAAHYESTKGSFKFTHDTWSDISRQRQSLAPDLAMVGWYHTHPGWGVFLSGMDQFICENFFGKKLDVALVVDPCRGDRGMFQWAVGEERQTVRTGGFFVTASRFRATQLEHFVAELSSQRPTSMSQRYQPSPMAPQPASIVPANAPPNWISSAVAAGLIIQCLLLAFLVLRTLSPVPAPAAASETQVEATLERLNRALAAIEARRESDLAAERVRAKTEFLDAAFRELKGTEAGSIQRLQTQFDQTTRLAADVSARDAEIRELKAAMDDARSQLQSAQILAQREEKRLAARIDELTAENSQLKSDVSKSRERLAASSSPADGEDTAGLPWEGTWWWIAGGAVAVVALVLGAWWISARANDVGTQADGGKLTETA